LNKQIDIEYNNAIIVWIIFTIIIFKLIFKILSNKNVKIKAKITGMKLGIISNPSQIKE
jgi:hypothetical protein